MQLPKPMAELIHVTILETETRCLYAMEAFLLRPREILGQHNLERSVDTTPGKSTLYSSNVDQVFFIRKMSPLLRRDILEQHLIVARSDVQGLQMQAGVGRSLFPLLSPLHTP